MGEYLIDDSLILDTGNHLDRSTASRASLYVNVKDSLESLCPGHRGVALSRGLFVGVFIAFGAFAAFGWCDQSTPAVIGGEQAVVPGEVNPGSGYQGCQARNKIDRLENDLGGAIAVRGL